MALLPSQKDSFFSLDSSSTGTLTPSNYISASNAFIASEDGYLYIVTSGEVTIGMCGGYVAKVWGSGATDMMFLKKGTDLWFNTATSANNVNRLRFVYTKNG